MKLAVVAGGWHWPLHFFQAIAEQASGADLFVVAHRSPELAIVREEKREILEMARGELADLDRELYADFPTVGGLRSLGWSYQEAPNTCGDWCFFNQWLKTHDYRNYDLILNCHDDTYVRDDVIGIVCDPFYSAMRPAEGWQFNDWLILANGRYPEAPEAYVRGSFEFWRREMLDLLGGQIDLGEVGLTREGQVDTPKGLNALSAWNNTGVPLRQFMAERGLSKRIAYLSPYYRISPWVIEGERGFLHLKGGAPWSFAEGLKAYPIKEIEAAGTRLSV